jgi:hypothetical protein
MGGYSATKTRKIIALLPAAANPADPCDLRFLVELVGVRSEVSRTLKVGDELVVALIARGSTRSAVVMSGGDVVGTLAAFRGLAQLISCIDRGHGYSAHVEAASPVRCSVLVERST